MKTKTILVVAVLAVMAPVAQAVVIEWSISEGGNGHFYEAVLAPDGIDWEGANTEAIAAGGYLATTTSSEENAFVYSLVSDNPDFWKPIEPVNAEGPWLGGFQPVGSPEPAGNWQWVTGEPWDYTNWVPIEPSGDETQNRLAFFGYYSRSGAQWNDLPNVNYLANGYIVEFVPEPATILLLGLGAVILRKRH